MKEKKIEEWYLIAAKLVQDDLECDSSAILMNFHLSGSTLARWLINANRFIDYKNEKYYWVYGANTLELFREQFSINYRSITGMDKKISYFFAFVLRNAKFFRTKNGKVLQDRLRIDIKQFPANL